MTTQLGKELKKLRIDIGVTLLGFSKMLGCSSAFLSAIETGKKRAPDNFLETLTAKVPAIKEQEKKFEALINQSRNEVKLNLQSGSFEDAMLATALARRFNALTEEEKQKLMTIVGGD